MIIHTSISSEFQKQYKTLDAYSIMRHLRGHYNEQASIKRFKVSKLIFGSKMEVGTSPVQYALKMYKHIERLDQLGYWRDLEFSIDLILARLPDSFVQFVLSYGMDHIISTIPELIDVLKIAEGKMTEKKGKKTAPKETCFYCGQVGHWRRNWKAYLESMKNVACGAPSSSSIYVIKFNIVSPNNIWVYDTNCGSYIWIDLQGLRNSRKLTKGESNFRVGMVQELQQLLLYGLMF